MWTLISLAVVNDYSSNNIMIATRNCNKIKTKRKITNHDYKHCEWTLIATRISFFFFLLIFFFFLSFSFLFKIRFFYITSNIHWREFLKANLCSKRRTLLPRIDCLLLVILNILYVVTIVISLPLFFSLSLNILSVYLILRKQICAAHFFANVYCFHLLSYLHLLIHTYSYIYIISCCCFFFISAPFFHNSMCLNVCVCVCVWICICFYFFYFYTNYCMFLITMISLFISLSLLIVFSFFSFCLTL